MTATKHEGVMADTKLRYRMESIGPRHDPYGRATLAVTLYGIENQLQSCAVNGTRYLTGGKVVIDWDHDSPTAEEEFTEATGDAPEKWEAWYHGRVIH